MLNRIQMHIRIATSRLYIGACAVYFITHTSESQPFAPWVIQVTRMLKSHVQLRHPVCVIGRMVSECASLEVKQTLLDSTHTFLSIQGRSAATVQASGTSTWGRCNRRQLSTKDISFSCAPENVYRAAGLQELSQHSGSHNSVDLLIFLAKVTS